jgi:hypothetical protein
MEKEADRLIMRTGLDMAEPHESRPRYSREHCGARLALHATCGR